MITPLTQRVLDATSVLFAQGEQNGVVRLLEEECGASLPLMTGDNSGKAIERIQLAVLKLSAGNWEHLQSEVETAKRDWRDSLVFAGFGDDIHAHLKWSPAPPLPRS